jgi:hypothetical protein
VYKECFILLVMVWNYKKNSPAISRVFTTFWAWAQARAEPELSPQKPWEEGSASLSEALSPGFKPRLLGGRIRAPAPLLNCQLLFFLHTHPLPIPMPRIDSSDDEIEEILLLPFKSSSGCVVKPSAALLGPGNVAKVPGQPHGTRNDPKESECEPKKKKAKVKDSGKLKNKEVPVPDVPGVRATLARCGDHTITQASRGEIQSMHKQQGVQV